MDAGRQNRERGNIWSQSRERHGGRGGGNILNLLSSFQLPNSSALLTDGILEQLENNGNSQGTHFPSSSAAAAGPVNQMAISPPPAQQHIILWCLEAFGNWEKNICLMKSPPALSQMLLEVANSTFDAVQCCPVQPGSKHFNRIDLGKYL